MLVNCIINFGWCTAGGAAVSAAPTELLGLLLGWCTSRGCSCPNCTNRAIGTTAWLVHLRQVHPLKLLHEQLLYLAVGCAHDVDATLKVLYAYSAEVVYLDVGVVVGSG